MPPIAHVPFCFKRDKQLLTLKKKESYINFLPISVMLSPQLYPTADRAGESAVHIIKQKIKIIKTALKKAL